MLTEIIKTKSLRSNIRSEPDSRPPRSTATESATSPAANLKVEWQKQCLNTSTDDSSVPYVIGEISSHVCILNVQLRPFSWKVATAAEIAKGPCTRSVDLELEKKAMVKSGCAGNVLTHH